jgi:hypothetical protein
MAWIDGRVKVDGFSPPNAGNLMDALFLFFLIFFSFLSFLIIAQQEHIELPR